MQDKKITPEGIREFLERLDIKLPEPRTMEGFGTELPLPYLERCLAIIVPAVDSYLDNCKQEVLQDFLQYVSQYKVAERKTVRKTEQKPPLKITIPAKNGPVTSEKLDPASLAIYNYFEANPGATRLKAVVDLGISLATLDRRLLKLKALGVEVKKNHTSRRSFHVTPKQVQDYFADNPGATIYDCASAFNISTSTVTRYRKYSCEEKTEAVGKPEPVAAATKPNEAVPEEPVTEAVPEPEIVSIPEPGPKPEAEPVPAYEEGGYMADVRARFEKRNQPEPEPVTVPEEKKPAKERPSRESEKASTVSLRSFSLLKYFNSLPAPMQDKAVAEHWDTASADGLAVEALNRRFAANNMKLRRRELTRMEYGMLAAILEDKAMSYLDKIRRYSDYLVKA